MATMQRTPQWLVRALGLLAGEAPKVLDPTVIPTVDTLQGGAGAAEWTFASGTLPTGALTNTVLLAADTKVHRLVQLSVNRTGVTAPNDLRLYSDGPNANVGQLSYWESLALATTVILTWNTIGNGQRFLSIPPGFRLVLRSTAITAPDEVTYRMIVCTVPAGSKIW